MRRLFNLFAALSSLLFFAVLIAWGRGCRGGGYPTDAAFVPLPAGRCVALQSSRAQAHSFLSLWLVSGWPAGAAPVWRSGDMTKEQVLPVHEGSWSPTWRHELGQLALQRVDGIRLAVDPQDRLAFTGSSPGQPLRAKPIRVYLITMPARHAGLATAALPLVLVARRLWRAGRRRRSPGHCSACGYDLRATPDRCPECGAVAEPPHNPPMQRTATAASGAVE